ncbi:S-adenosyl-L-methionine-dependent methyltransferase [Phytophthora cactorum]|nr:S-adenosyl-L-methionine-dependent methyltransferase [Phytophthora cactorum]
MVLELNASDDRGIDVVRNQIKEFAGTKKLFSQGVKLIILDEADSMTNDAQFSLRRVIEKYTKNARFCLICNYVSKIIPALQSRCTRFRFAPLNESQVSGRVKHIAQLEKLDMTEDGFKAILRLGQGDMRRILNILQATSMAHDVVNEANVYLCTGNPLPKDIESVTQWLFNENFTTAVRKCAEMQKLKGYATSDILQDVYRYTTELELPPRCRMYLYDELAKLEHRLSNGTTEELQLASLVAVFAIAREQMSNAMTTQGHELLPRKAEDFRKQEYWDQFFQKRGEKAFEWYGDYSSLRPGLQALLGLPDDAPASLLRRLKAKVRVLVVGCGNSALSADLAADGFLSLLSVDFSARVIDEMRRKHPALQWQVMDMTDMRALEDASFDLVMDKGALDALMAEDTPEIKRDASKMLREVRRVLSPGGRYCCVTMAQDFILQHLLGFFSLKDDTETEPTHWSVGVQELPRDARKPFAPFLAAALKCPKSDSKAAKKAQYNAKQFISDVGEARQQWLIHEVEATQWFAMTQAALRQLKLGRQEIIELIANDEKDATKGLGQNGAVEGQVNPRFTLRLVDAHMRGPNGSCAVFLIPQGREHEWMFSTEEGANELAAGAGFSRLIIVALGRGGHAFESTAKVQEELNAKVMELAPDTLGPDEKIPYLTVEEGLGARNIVHQGTSPLSGAFFVEEVQEDGETLRRLVFLSNTNVIQSEVKMLARGSTGPTPAATPVSVEAPADADTSDMTPEEAAAAARKKKNNKKKNQKKKKKAQAKQAGVDTSYLAFDYHKGMVASLHAASLSSRAASDSLHRTLVLGLGGGCLAQYLHDNVPAWIEKPSFDSIIVDVDAKQRDVGMSCPPVSFVEDAFLAHVHSLLAPRGVLLINVSCRDSGLYKEIIARLQRVFSGSRAVLALKPSEQDVNSVVFIRKADTKEPDAKTLLQQLHDQGRRRGDAQNAPRYIDDELCELIRDIQITK